MATPPGLPGPLAPSTPDGASLACSCERAPTCDRPAEYPLVRHSVNDATCNAAQLGRWWRGLASRDLDPLDGLPRNPASYYCGRGQAVQEDTYLPVGWLRLQENGQGGAEPYSYLILGVYCHLPASR